MCFLEEAIVGAGQPQQVGHLCGVGSRLDADGQHYQVGLHFHRLAQ